MSEQHPFDRLSKLAGRQRPRRTALGAITALLPGILTGSASAGGKKNGGKKQKSKKHKHKRPAHLGEPIPGVDDCEGYLNEPWLVADCKKIRRTCKAPDHLCIHVNENPADEDTRGVACCPNHTDCCWTGCTDTRNDDDNCGACGQPCGDGAVCVNRACICLDGRTHCDGECRDTTSDPNYCGDCDTYCAPGQVCRQGRCGCPETCPLGQLCLDNQGYTYTCNGQSGPPSSDCHCGCGPFYRYCPDFQGGACVSPNSPAC